MPTPEMLALIGATFFFAGVVKGTLGMGLPTIILGVLAAPLGLKEAIGFMLLPSLCANLWQGLVGGFFLELLRRFWAFFLVAVFGIGIGVWILAGSRNELLLGLLGTVLCVHVGLSLSGKKLPPPKAESEHFYGPVAGGLGGMMFGMTGVFVVPGILYLQALEMKRDMLVQAMGLSFLIITVAIFAFMTRWQLIAGDQVLVSGLALLPMFAGIALGYHVRQRISESVFRRLILIGLLISGVHLLIRSFL